ncbi:MAG: transporter substrate-binding domain-containing protein [Bauldia sp.]|nr:transporter substrate-binding domain-containing protein [Bauldia sp.]
MWLRTLALGFLFAAPPAMAQLMDDVTVPNEWLQNWRRTEGDQIAFCVAHGSDTAAFEQAVGEELAAALLLKPVFVESQSGFSIDGMGYLDAVLLSLTNECDVMLGMALVTGGGYPDWLTVTRPYAGVPFLVTTTQNAAYRSLGDVPPGRTIGTQIVSAGDTMLYAYVSQLPPSEQWRRLPYGDSGRLVERLRDGTLDAIIIYEPALMTVTEGDPAAAGLQVIAAEPLRDLEVPIGAVLLSRNIFLRTQLDSAIASLVADGTIARLMAEHGLGGTPGGP